MCCGACQTPPDLPFTSRIELYGDVVGAGDGVARLRSGQTLLVHAAAGGVAVLRSSSARPPAREVAVVGGPHNAEVAVAPKTGVVGHRCAQDFVEVVKAETDGRGTDVRWGHFLRPVHHVRCLRERHRRDRFRRRHHPDPMLNHALPVKCSTHGLHFGLYVRRRPELAQACHEALCDLAAHGLIAPPISERVPLAERQPPYSGALTAPPVGHGALQSTD